jgi:hypothetical protein
MSQVTESFSELEKVMIELDALSLKEKFWVVDRLMQGIRSQTLSVSPIELDESANDPLEYVDGVLVIKSQGKVLSGDLVNDMREDRMQDVTGW